MVDVKFYVCEEDKYGDSKRISGLITMSMSEYSCECFNSEHGQEEYRLVYDEVINKLKKMGLRGNPDNWFLEMKKWH